MTERTESRHCKVETTFTPNTIVEIVIKSEYERTMWSSMLVAVYDVVGDEVTFASLDDGRPILTHLQCDGERVEYESISQSIDKLIVKMKSIHPSKRMSSTALYVRLECYDSIDNVIHHKVQAP